MAILNPLVVVAGQVRELPAPDSLYATTQGVGTAGNVVASTQFVRNAIGVALTKDVGSGGFVALNVSEASNPVITVTGALTSDATLEIPSSLYRIYAIYNNTTGAFSLSIKQAGASPVVPVTQGTRALVVTGGGAFDALTDFDGIALTGVSTAPTAAAGTNTTQIATMAAVQAAVQGVLTKFVTGGTTTLTAEEASTPLITIAGTLTSNAVIEVPTGIARLYAVSNQTTGAFSVSLKQVGFASLAGIAQGKKNLVYMTGTGASDAMTDFESIVMTGSPLAPTVATSSNGFEVANAAFVKAAIAAAPAPPVTVVEKQFYFYTANTTLTVPAGVSVVRFYAGGRGGNGGGVTFNTLRAGGGGGGGFAFGDMDVVAGDVVSFTVTAGVARVLLNGVLAGTANAGSNGAAASGSGTAAGGTGGTATIAGFVTNGGAYPGGKGGDVYGQVAAPMGAGGGSCGSPLGPGVAGGNATTNSGSTGGHGGAGAGIGGGAAETLGVTVGGGGAGDAGTTTYGGGSTSDGSTRSLTSAFSDPLLRLAIAPRTIPGAAAWSGAGGYDSAGGDFGGGSGVPAATPLLVGYAGGLMAGGGGIATLTNSSPGNKFGGAGGFGGGGGGCGRGSGVGSGAGGAGGAAFCFFYY